MPARPKLPASKPHLQATRIHPSPTANLTAPPGCPRAISNPTCLKQTSLSPLPKNYPPSQHPISTLVSTDLLSALSQGPRPPRSLPSCIMESVWDFPIIHGKTGATIQRQIPTVCSGIFQISWPGVGPRYLQSVKAPHLIFTNRI